MRIDEEMGQPPQPSQPSQPSQPQNFQYVILGMILATAIIATSTAVAIAILKFTN